MQVFIPQSLADLLTEAHGAELDASAKEKNLQAVYQATIEPLAVGARQARDTAESLKAQAEAGIRELVVATLSAQAQPAPKPAPPIIDHPTPQGPPPAPPADPQPAPAPQPVAPPPSQPAPVSQPAPAPAPAPAPQPAPAPAPQPTPPPAQPAGMGQADAQGNTFAIGPDGKLQVNGAPSNMGSPAVLQIVGGVAFIGFHSGNAFAFQNGHWAQVVKVGDLTPFVAQPAAQPKPA